MTSVTPLLEVKDLRLQFGGIQAIRDVGFSLASGELLAVVGPNGAGKTALLNCINGVYQPTSGHITLAGQEVTGMPLRYAAAKGIGRAFQHMELFGHLTVVENMLLGLHSRMRRGLLSNLLYLPATRREEALQREHAEALIDFFELNRYRDHHIGNLPYGVQKLVGVARALAVQPKLLLLDEPSTGLVREEKEHLARFLLRVRHEMSPSIIWIEHDMQMVSDLADRVLVLNYGEVIAEGLPADVRKNQEVIRSYLGETE
jgi:branched-chain amino acid transport system ATP-binding protein